MKRKIRVFLRHGPRRWTALLAVLGFLCGCASSVPFDAPKATSHAPDQAETANTYLGRLVAPLIEAHPGESGFMLLDNGIDALAARLLLSRTAERSIDAQYYLVLDDVTGRIFALSLLSAADRGVRVRLLLDDMTTEDRDFALAALDSHPDIEIRVFNPFSRDRSRLLSGATEFRRINRRMHNKSMTADNQVTIVGGRNIGAEYFDARGDGNYSDLDVLGIGPVVDEVSTAFDVYWNDPVSVPASLLIDQAGASEKLAELRARIPDFIEQARQSPFGEALESTILESIGTYRTQLSWGPATVVADPPEKASEDYAVGHPEQLSSVMGPIVRAAESELAVVSAYFVPGDRGVELFRELTERGVRVLIVTNSLASNDVVPVFAGYSRYRKALLEAGVELWEVRPEQDPQEHRRRRLGYSLSGLHMKAFAVDRRYLFIGSFNWDPRSVNINTEMGVYLDVPDLATSALEGLERQLRGNAYRLRLGETGEIEWMLQEDGREAVYRDEPEASFWKQFTAGFYALLPIESQL